ncbi:MAG: hypothetical protein ACI9UN_002255 [Granulosicoccus sp.]|jgi:hypothetical protein
MIKFLVLELEGSALYAKPPPGYAIPGDGS